MRKRKVSTVFDRQVRLLLIEDSEDQAELVATLLQRGRGAYAISTAKTLAQARATLKTHEFDIILSDLGLPDSDGMSTVRELLALTEASVPVVVLSAHEGDVMTFRALELGAQDYIAKSTLNTNILERSLRYALERFNTLHNFHRILHNSPDGILVIGRDGRVLLGNAAAAGLLAWEGNIQGKVFPIPLEETVQRQVHLPSGIWVEMRVAETRWRGRRASLVALRDVTERRQRAERLRHLAHFDQLTGLANRTLFRDRLDSAVERASREQGRFALFAFDLDRFKNVNDSFGHDMGDLLLVQVASRLRSVTRAADTLARLGGDEFALIAEQIEDRAAAGAVAEKIIDLFAKPFLLDSQHVEMTTSIGIAMFPDDADEQEKLTIGADSAMYDAKAKGRNTFQYFSQGTDEIAVDRLRLETRVREAHKRGEYELHYQPIVGPSGTYAVEALLRWRHPERGIVLPESFLGVLEQGGYVCEVGRWAMQEALSQLKVWRVRHDPNLRVVLNVSLRQLQEESFMQDVANALAAAELSGDALEIDLQEGILLNAGGPLIEAVKSIRELGVRVAIDDFGTGYSSLTRLASHSFVDAIKIDGSFVNQVGVDPVHSSVVRGVIALGNALELDVVAEGVESAEQHAFLLAHGCSIFQGFYFSQPLSADRFRWSAYPQPTPSPQLLA